MALAWRGAGMAWYGAWGMARHGMLVLSIPFTEMTRVSLALALAPARADP